LGFLEAHFGLKQWSSYRRYVQRASWNRDKPSVAGFEQLPPMNDIAKLEQEPRQLQRLAAQRQLYSTAKKIFGIQLLLSGPVAIGWSLAVVVSPQMRWIAAVWGVLVSSFDVLWLTPWQKRLRERAAKIQEAFDCDVLQLPWNDIKTGRRPDPELVKEQADKYQKAQAGLPPLTDWYAPVVSELPLEVGRVICQRANCWWDSKQRRRYAAWVIVSVIIVTLLMVCLGVVGGLTVEKLFPAIILPLSPALLLGLRQFSEQTEAANRLDKLKDHAESLWLDSWNGAARPELTSRSRALQDEIFENRKRSPLVFDWIFRRLRDDYDAQVNHGAEELAAEAKWRLGMTG
jgi:hypothetical protein